MDDWQVDVLRDEIKETKQLAIGTSRALRDVQQTIKAASPRKLKDTGPAATLIKLAVCELLREGRMGAQGPRLVESATEVAEKRYGHDRAVLDAVARAAVSPMNTTTVGAGAELVQSTTVASFLAAGDSPSAFAQLSARVLTVGVSGSVSVPSRSHPVTLSGGWVAEGSAKPVYAFSLTPLTLTPFKLACMSVWSEELSRASTPTVEAVVADVLRHDLGGLLDTALLDATAASATRPAGLWNGATAVTASALTPASEAMQADLAGLAAAVGTNAPDARPVFIANTKQAVRMKAAGLAEDLIVSGYQAVNSVGCVDANSLVLMIGDIAFKSSISAAIHMDSAATALSAAGSPNTVAAPLSSLFQNNLVGLRSTLFASWSTRRTGATALASSVV